MSDSTIESRTGCTWEGWVAALDALGADRLTHGEIAALRLGALRAVLSAD